MEKTKRFRQGPIEEVSWGRFVINGKENRKKEDGSIVGAGKDIFLMGDHVQPWYERQGHLLTIRMVRRAAEAPVQTVIIGNGFYGALEVPEDVIRFLQKSDKTVHIKKTPEACALFNELFLQGQKVALLAHGTC